MVAFSSLFVALSAIAGTLASPSGLSSRTPTASGLTGFNIGLDHVLNQGRNRTALGPRTTVDYDQDFTTGGDVIFTPNGASFTVDWDTADDFVVGVGWKPGQTL